ncbi:hypothetical protein Mpsy_1970 [Methanolobus psychrophilus R15]|nr:hypothetical protein Mpsy_1970 [Methanolobus psychrophilus R15]
MIFVKVTFIHSYAPFLYASLTPSVYPGSIVFLFPMFATIHITKVYNKEQHRLHKTAKLHMNTGNTEHTSIVNLFFHMVYMI